PPTSDRCPDGSVRALGSCGDRANDARPSRRPGPAQAPTGHGVCAGTLSVMESPATGPLGPRELVGQFDAAMRDGVVARLVAHLPAGVSLTEVRDGFVDRVGGRPGACWQDVWDSWVAEGGGTVTFWVSRCETCRGRRVDVRRGRVCATCAGRGSHRHQVQVRAFPAPRPNSGRT